MKAYLLFCATFIFISTTFPESTEQQIRLLLQDSASGITNQAFIYFSPELSTTYDSSQDEEMIFDTLTAVPNIYSFTSDGIPCYSLGYGAFTKTTTVRLGINVAGGSTCVFYMASLNNFDPATIVLLEDQSTGVSTDLRRNSYSVPIASGSGGRIDNRFFLLVSYPPQISITQADCNNTNGVVSVTEDNSITWTTCHLYNSHTNQVGIYKDITGNFNFPSLPEDTYEIEFDYGFYAATKNIFLPGNQISLSISASTTTPLVGQNVSFFSNEINAEEYEWQMGDSSIISGVSNPTYAYLMPGTYQALLTCSNPYGCSATGSLLMNVSDTGVATVVNSLSSQRINVFSYNMDITIQIVNGLPDEYIFQLYNLSGQMLKTGPVTSSDFVIHSGDISSGIYVLTLIDRTAQLTMSKKLDLMQ